MPPIQLLPIDADLAESLASGTFEATYSVTVSDLDPTLGIVRQTLAMPALASEPWGGYLTVGSDMGEVVGMCAFKSAPSSGAVEIAYYTFPAFEGRGYATAAANALVAVAASGGVATVVAHTLPEPNASTRALQRVDFAFAGSVVDPEDGPVWRWTLALPKL